MRRSELQFNADFDGQGDADHAGGLIGVEGDFQLAAVTFNDLAAYREPEAKADVARGEEWLRGHGRRFGAEPVSVV